MSGGATFGEALREQRYQSRLTQAELAERAGLSERAISDLERGLKQPQRATVRLLIDALHLSPDAAEQFAGAARAQPSTAEPKSDKRSRHNLPPRWTSFVGREHDITRLETMFQSPGPEASRAVTLTGTGECGKARLAIEVAARLLDMFPDGVWFADLSSTTDPALVAHVALTATADRHSSDQAPMERLLRTVRGRSLLLVLDNCEHLVDSCAELVIEFLRASSGSRVLATSREALRVPGEVAWRVPSLEGPQKLSRSSGPTACWTTRPSGCLWTASNRFSRIFRSPAPEPTRMLHRA